MNTVQRNRRRKACLFITLSLTVLCLLGILLSALSNLGLPERSKTLDRLADLEKARLLEVNQLRSTFGDEVWPGWSQADIPVIVYNEQYVFLVGLPEPAPGWFKVPSMEARGETWEAIQGDDFAGSVYYQTRIEDPETTPEAFTVLVGDRWVATFQTREYSRVAFYRDFRAELPPGFASIVPVRLVWLLLMGNTEAYIAALEHEAFHAYQGTLAPDRLAAAERSVSVEASYPFDAMDEPWRQEMEALVRAARAGSPDEARQMAREFLALRAARRESLTQEQVEYEQLREWEEGLAKYAELQIGRLAANDNRYQPVAGLSQDSEFQDYRGRARFWSNQLNEAKNTRGRSGETRFYYSGNALAVALDLLSPGWKSRALPGGEYLEDLLEEAVN